MSTLDERAIFNNKTILGVEKLGQYGLDAIWASMAADREVAFPQPGWIDVDGQDGRVALTGSTNHFQVEANRYGVTGDSSTTGHFLILTNTLGSISTLYPFPNGNGTNYNVYACAMRWPTLVESNTRTGELYYSREQEVLAYQVALSSGDVTNMGDGTIKLRIDNLFDGGGDHSGRKVRVWLTTPMSSVDATAFETLDVFYSGGHNYVLSAGVFGQEAVSTTPSDYKVALVGYYCGTSVPSGDRLFVGSVIGGGGTVTPSTDVTAQSLFISSSAISTLFRTDAHGSVKLRVFTDDDDIDEPQLEVYSVSSAETRFYVDESGFVTSGAPGSSNAGKFTMRSTGADASMRASNGHIVFDTDSDKTVVMVHPIASGEALVSSAMSLSTGFPADANVGSGLTQCFTGAINALKTAGKSGFTNQAISGGTMSSGSGSVSPTALVAVVDGCLRTVSFSTLTPADGTWYIYWDYTAATATSAVAPVATASLATMPAGSILLAQIVRAGGTVTTVQDLRHPFVPLGKTSAEILVGGTGTGAHFATIGEAVAFIKMFRQAGGEAEVHYRRIRVIGSVTETSTVTLSAGIEVRGVSTQLFGSPSVAWAFNGALFTIDGNGVAIENLTLRSNHVSSYPTFSRHGVEFSASTYSVRLRDLNMLSGSAGSWAHTFVYSSSSYTQTDMVVENCVSRASTDHGIIIYHGERVSILGCKVEQRDAVQVAAQAALSSGISLPASSPDCVVHRCKSEGFVNGIVIADRGVVDSCSSVDANTYCYCVAGSNTRVVNCYGIGHTSSTEAVLTPAGLVVLSGTRLFVSGNNLTPPNNGSTRYGMLTGTTPNSDYSIFVGNQTNGKGFSNNNVGNTTSANNRDD